MKIALLAAIAHGMNLAYSASLGDQSHLPWEETSEELKKSIEYGVKLHLENPHTTPEQSHESWLAQKEADGWVYGEIKDLENKTHPCILPYEQLPAEQKTKDYLFKAVVTLLKDLPDPDDVSALNGELVKLQLQVTAQKAKPQSGNAAPVAGVTIVYQGPKEQFQDNLYGTKLVFKRGESRTVPSNYAKQFLSHPEFKEVEAGDAPAAEGTDDTAAILAQQEAQQKQEQERQDRIFNEVESIKQFGTKKAVTDYIEANYGEKVNPNSFKLDELKDKAIEKVRQFGAI
ncbi:RyR domain-containing protein [Acinetobacter sp. 197]|uniref:RyR domain-containing protein n=1 Tax=Acinetobacter sp. 197 TaxID=3114696 RepID=UPI003A89AEC3